MEPDILGENPFWAKAGIVVGVTIVLTTSFIGVLSFVTGQTGPIENRLAIYFLLMGVAFVVGIFSFAKQMLDGVTVLLATVGGSLLTLVTVLLAGEGIRYTILSPDEVFQVQLLGYLASAGLIVTGLSYWTIRYWRQIVSGDGL